MIEEIIFSKVGFPVASVDGIPINSIYDPIKEAERFVESKNLGQDFSIILLINPGLCYLVPPLRKLLPRARIIALHCSSYFKNQIEHTANSLTLGIFKPDSQWSYSDEINVNTFLENELDDFEAGTTKLIEWRPATKAYGMIALKLIDSILDYLRSANANAMTSEKFGKRWIRNTIRFTHSYIGPKQYLKRSSKPIVVAASGPSLEDFIQDFHNHTNRDQYVLLALSSAVESLLGWDIIPDIIVATDGGNWAKFHLFEAVRRKIPLVVNPVGALPSQYYDLPLFVISDGTCWQQAITQNIISPVLIAPQRGTVAATAIDLALYLTSEEIFITGLDLGVRNGHSHARPNALDRFYHKSENRIQPSVTGDYQRYLDNKHTASLDIYAKWFSNKCKTYGKRLIVLGKPSQALAELTSVERLLFNKIYDSTNLINILSGYSYESEKYHVHKKKNIYNNNVMLINRIKDECSMDILDIKKIRDGVCGELLPLIAPDLYRLLLIRCRLRRAAGKELIIRILKIVREELLKSEMDLLDKESSHG